MWKNRHVLKYENLSEAGEHGKEIYDHFKRDPRKIVHLVILLIYLQAHRKCQTHMLVFSFYKNHASI